METQPHRSIFGVEITTYFICHPGKTTPKQIQTLFRTNRILPEYSYPYWKIGIT